MTSSRQASDGQGSGGQASSGQGQGSPYQSYAHTLLNAQEANHQPYMGGLPLWQWPLPNEHSPIPDEQSSWRSVSSATPSYTSSMRERGHDDIIYGNSNRPNPPANGRTPSPPSRSPPPPPNNPRSASPRSVPHQPSPSAGSFPAPPSHSPYDYPGPSQHPRVWTRPFPYIPRADSYRLPGTSTLPDPPRRDPYQHPRHLAPSLPAPPRHDSYQHPTRWTQTPAFPDLPSLEPYQYPTFEQPPSRENLPSYPLNPPPLRRRQRSQDLRQVSGADLRAPSNASAAKDVIGNAPSPQTLPASRRPLMVDAATQTSPTPTPLTQSPTNLSRSTTPTPADPVGDRPRRSIRRRASQAGQRLRQAFSHASLRSPNAAEDNDNEESRTHRLGRKMSRMFIGRKDRSPSSGDRSQDRSQSRIRK